MLRVLAAAPASLCHSNDADSAAVMTFPHCHANIPRSLWPAVSLSPTISPGLANKLPGPSLDTEWRPQSSHGNKCVQVLKLSGLIEPK